MSLKHIADHLASKGRGDDSVLIHMTPGEVGGLQALAMAHGGSLTVNPETGLPEAGFLKNILPTLVGFGANLIAPGLGTAATLALGAGTGALLNQKNPLMGALLGGVGAYGGAGIAGGINAAGTAAAAAAETTLPTAVTSGVQPSVGNLEMVSPEWTGQAAALPPPVPMQPPMMAPQVPSVVQPNPLIPSTATPIVPPNPAVTAGYPAVEPPVSVGEIGQGLEPGRGMGAWNAEELARRPVTMTPFEKIGATFEQPEAFMKGAGGASGLIKYGTAAAAPVLLGPSDKEQKKPWWATAELPEYTYERGYTGGTRLPGSAESSERRYFDPRFVRMAEGGSVEDQLANARRMGRGFGAAVNIANDATRSFLAGDRAAIPGIIQSNMSRALSGAPATPQALGIAALQQPQYAAPAQPLYLPQTAAPQAPMFNMPQMRQAAGPGLQTGVRAIDLISAAPQATASMPRYSNPYVGPMTGASASAARYLAGQTGAGNQPVRQGPSAPIYPIGGGEPITVGPLGPRPAPAPAPTATSPAPAPTDYIADRGDRMTIMPVPPQAPAPSGGLTSLMPVYGAPTFAPPAPVYTAPEPAYAPPAPVYTAPEPAYAPPAPVYTSPMPVYGAPTFAPAPEDRVRIPPPVVGRSPEEPPSAPVAPPPPLSLDELINAGQPNFNQQQNASEAWLATKANSSPNYAQTKDYLLQNPDVLQAAMASGQDPGVFATNHYNQYGRYENRPGTDSLQQYLSYLEERFSGNAAGGQLKSGGFVVPADVVSALGNGSTDAGLEVLMSKYKAKPIDGPGDGMSDSIPTTIEGRQKARVARGEAYIRPEDVQRAGGSEKLYGMLDRIRKNAHGKTTQQRKVNPTKVA